MSIILILVEILIFGLFSWLVAIVGIFAAVWLLSAAVRRSVRPAPTRSGPALDRMAVHGAPAVGGYSSAGHSRSDSWDDWSRSPGDDASGERFTDWYIGHQVWDPLGKTDGGIAESYINHKLWP